MATQTKVMLKVLCIFRADCKATKGHGSTLALIQGESGKCRLYGKDSLANAYPDDAQIIKTLTNAGKMADQFKVKVMQGKAACDKFMTDHKLSFEGSEEIISDAGKSGKKRGGFRTINYSIF